jgi:hypothetical protein
MKGYKAEHNPGIASSVSNLVTHMYRVVSLD